MSKLLPSFPVLFQQLPRMRSRNCWLTGNKLVSQAHTTLIYNSETCPREPNDWETNPKLQAVSTDQRVPDFPQRQRDEVDEINLLALGCARGNLKERSAMSTHFLSQKQPRLNQNPNNFVAHNPTFVAHKHNMRPVTSLRTCDLGTLVFLRSCNGPTSSPASASRSPWRAEQEKEIRKK